MEKKFVVMAGVWLAVSAVTLSGCAPVLVGGAATGAYFAQDRRSISTQIDDQALEAEIHNILENDEVYQQVHVKISTFNGLVLLLGDVPNEAMHQKVLALLDGQKAVKRVVDELQMRNKRDLEAVQHDSWLGMKVKSAMLTAEDFPGLRVTATADQGVVYLQGIVSQHEGEWAAKVASTVGGVTKVVKVFDYVD